MIFWWHIIRHSSHRQSLSSKLVWSQLVQGHTKKLNQINMIASVQMILSNKMGSRRHHVHSGGGGGGGSIRWWGAGHWGVLVVTLVVVVGGGQWRSVVGDVDGHRHHPLGCWLLRRWWWWWW